MTRGLCSVQLDVHGLKHVALQLRVQYLMCVGARTCMCVRACMRVRAFVRVYVCACVCAWANLKSAEVVVKATVQP